MRVQSQRNRNNGHMKRKMSGNSKAVYSGVQPRKDQADRVDRVYAIQCNACNYLTYFSFYVHSCNSLGDTSPSSVNNNINDRSRVSTEYHHFVIVELSQT